MFSAIVMKCDGLKSLSKFLLVNKWKKQNLNQYTFSWITFCFYISIEGASFIKFYFLELENKYEANNETEKGK